MGYRSRITNFKAEPLPVKPGVSEEKVLSALNAVDPEYGDQIRFFFDLDSDIEEDGEFYMEPSGEGGKGYDLIEALEALVAILRTLAHGPQETRGFRFRFEIIGEEGDHRLVQSDGVELTVTPGVVTYPGAPDWPVETP